MSEGQFAYNGFTLDELRSLASSPQVGTIQAMPQSFRALADRVGEVADLLTHAQADLPNWWKGPAADQAAATLGRAAAEAREFHGSALAAASAVSRCAQVVAEQQHQMMSVPEVAAPGITDVVQRPTTPFEALEAARQDAAYQAAHEQAVQVVNGIAAQYVETRDGLALITTTHGENFTGAAIIPGAAAEGKEAQPANDDSNTEERATKSPLFREREYKSSAKHFIVNEAMPKESRALVPAKPALSSRETKPRLTGSQTSGFTSRSGTHFDTPEPAVTDPPLVDLRDWQARTGAGADSKTAVASAAKGAPASDEQPSLEATNLTGYLHEHSGLEADDQLTASRIQRNPSTATSRNALGTQNINRTPFREREHVGKSDVEYPAGLNVDNPLLTSPQPVHQSPIEGANNDSSAIIPPYSSIGNPGRTREERNPRPAYLKERKSAWLPDTVAVPADGVIWPDWH